MTEKVFQEMVFCHRDSMYRFAKNLLSSEPEAQDAVQSVMLKLWQQKEKLGKMGALKAYAIRAVKNECLNRIQQLQTNNRHLAIAGKMQPVMENNTRGNMRQVISKFITGLPTQQKLVILLKDIEEFETHEIAAMLDMEEPAVRTNLARARQKVRDHLQKIETYEQQQIR